MSRLFGLRQAKVIYHYLTIVNCAPAERCISDTVIHLTLNRWPVAHLLLVEQFNFLVDNYPESRLTPLLLVANGAAGGVLITLDNRDCNICRPARAPLFFDNLNIESTVSL